MSNALRVGRRTFPPTQIRRVYVWVAYDWRTSSKVITSKTSFRQYSWGHICVRTALRSAINVGNTASVTRKNGVLLGLVLFYFYLLIVGLLLTDLSNVGNVRQLNYTNIIFKRWDVESHFWSFMGLTLQDIVIVTMLGVKKIVEGPLLLKSLFVGLRTMSPSVTA